MYIDAWDRLQGRQRRRGGKLTIRVLRPEDLVGLKVQAMVNDNSRWTNDLADIEGIMALYKAALDWSIIEEYFALFGPPHIRPGYEVIGGRGRMGFGGGRR
jgi:hypothetical protein